MIPKSGYRFSGEIMRLKRLAHDLINGDQIVGWV